MQTSQHALRTHRDEFNRTSEITENLKPNNIFSRKREREANSESLISGTVLKAKIPTNMAEKKNKKHEKVVLNFNSICYVVFFFNVISLRARRRRRR